MLPSQKFLNVKPKTKTNRPESQLTNAFSFSYRDIAMGKS
jgi:hypothetical protein